VHSLNRMNLVTYAELNTTLTTMLLSGRPIAIMSDLVFFLDVNQFHRCRTYSRYML